MFSGYNNDYYSGENAGYNRGISEANGTINSWRRAHDDLLDQYNQLVNKYNALLDKYKNKKARHSADIDDYNKLLGEHKQTLAQLEAEREHKKRLIEAFDARGVTVKELGDRCHGLFSEAHNYKKAATWLEGFAAEAEALEAVKSALLAEGQTCPHPEHHRLSHDPAAVGVIYRKVKENPVGEDATGAKEFLAEIESEYAYLHTQP